MAERGRIFLRRSLLHVDYVLVFVRFVLVCFPSFLFLFPFILEPWVSVILRQPNYYSMWSNCILFSLTLTVVTHVELLFLFFLKKKINNISFFCSTTTMEIGTMESDLWPANNGLSSLLLFFFFLIFLYSFFWQLIWLVCLISLQNNHNSTLYLPRYLLSVLLTHKPCPWGGEVYSVRLYDNLIRRETMSLFSLFPSFPWLEESHLQT